MLNSDQHAKTAYHGWLSNWARQGFLPPTGDEIWLSAWFDERANPQTVGNLKAKIAELEERLGTFRDAHREEIRQLESRDHNQSSLLRDKDETIRHLREEVKSWKERLDGLAKELQEQHQREIIDLTAEIEEQVRDEHQERQEEALKAQQAHLEAVKQAALAAQRILLEEEFRQQTHQLITKLESHYQERYQDLAKTHREHFEARLAREVGERTEAQRAELAKTQREVGLMIGGPGASRSRPIPPDDLISQQIDDLTRRFLADEEVRRQRLQERVGQILDQLSAVAKGLIGWEIGLPSGNSSSPAWTDMANFEAWYAQVVQVEPRLENIKEMARWAWSEAIARSAAK